MITPIFAQAGNFGVDIGDTFTYDCEASSRDITLGSNSASASGYEVDEQHFDEGTSVDVEVLAFETSFGNTTIFEIQAGSYTENSSSSNFGVQLGGLLMIFFPLLFMGAYVNETAWNQTEAEADPGMMMEPFVEPGTATWDIFKDLAQEAQTATTMFSGAESNLQIHADYTESATEFLFESYLNGTYEGNVTDGSSILFIDYTNVQNHFQMVYNIVTGVMKGMQLEGSLTGTSNGTAIQIDYHFQTELSGYNLPNYQWGDVGWWPFPGFGFFAAIGAISSLFIIAVIIRKRK